MKLRKIIIVFVIAIVLLSGTISASSYVPKYNDYAEKLSKIGVFVGSAAGFELDREPTRLEAAVMLVRLLGAENIAHENKYEHPFKDVQEWGNDYIGYLYHEKLTNGINSDTFGSDDIINSKSYSTFILRALGYSDVNGDFSWSESLSFLKTKALINNSDYIELNSKKFYRDQLAKISYLALMMPVKSSTNSLAVTLINKHVIDKNIAQEIELVKYVYLATRKEIDWKAPDVLGLAQQITKGLETDYDKTKAIYSWVCENITYESYYPYVLKNEPWYHFTYASTVAKNKKTNCLGFTHLVAALNRAVGIEARVVDGWTYSPKYPTTWMKEEETRHAWDEVLIDGVWMIQDSTMDTKRYPTKYFNPTPENFALDHNREDIVY